MRLLLMMKTRQLFVEQTSQFFLRIMRLTILLEFALNDREFLLDSLLAILVFLVEFAFELPKVFILDAEDHRCLLTSDAYHDSLNG